MDGEKEITLYAIEKATAHYYTTRVAYWKYNGLQQIAKERGCSFYAVVTAAVDDLLAKEGITRPVPPHVSVEIKSDAANVGLLHKIVLALRGEGGTRHGRT